MSEVKITIEAPGLVEAINALAAAMAGKTPCTSNIGPGTEAPAPAVPQMPTQPVAPAIPPQMPQAPAAPVPTSYPAAAPVAPQMPTQPVPAAPSMTTPAPVSAPASVPSVPSNPAITIEALSNAGAALCEKGMMPQLVGLLQKYGCQAITQLKPEYIPAFAAELRALGAAI